MNEWVVLAAVMAVAIWYVSRARRDGESVAKMPAPRPAAKAPTIEEDFQGFLHAAIANAKPGLIRSERRRPDGTLADQRPLLIYMEQPVMAVLFPAASTLNAIWAPTAREALAAVESTELCGVLALSPMSESGQAAKVIAACRARWPGALTIYHGWDYRIDVSGPKALAAGADALILGGVETNELMGFVFGCLGLKGSGQLPPPSLENYEKLLRDMCPQSAFWKGAEMLRSSGAAPSPYE